jgi:hypothetical protein
MLGLGKLRDVLAGVLQRDELASARQRNRFFEAPLPSLFQASMTPAFLISVRPEAFRRPRIFVITAHIAIAARHAGTAAGAGVLALPRLIGMVLAHPPAAIAE